MTWSYANIDWNGTGAMVQAVGSVAAIIAAVIIASRQTREQLRRDQRADLVYLEALIATAEVGRAIIESAEETVGKSQMKAKSEILDAADPAWFADAEHALRAFPLERAPTPGCVKGVLEMIAALVWARKVVEKCLQSRGGLGAVRLADPLDNADFALGILRAERDRYVAGHAASAPGSSSKSRSAA